MTPVVRDLAHPDFPHGTATGFQRGCTEDAGCPASPTCREDRRRRQRAARKRRELGIGHRGVPAHQVLLHVLELRSAAVGASDHAIAAAAGLSPEVFRVIRRTGTTTRTTAAKLLAVRPEDVTTADVDADLVRVLVRQMQACGFSVAWMERRLGMDSTLNTVLSNPTKGARRPRRHVRRATYDAVVGLAAELGGRMADPRRDGLTLRQIACARAIARRHGYHPPSAYDEDGQVDPRSLPDHPWARADDQIARLLDMAHAVCTVGMREASTAPARRAVGEGDSEGAKKMVERITKRLGLRWVHPNHAPMVSSELYRANAAVIRRVVEVYGRYEAGQLGPIEAGVEMGLINAKYLGKLPADHPEVVAVRAAARAAA